MTTRLVRAVPFESRTFRILCTPSESRRPWVCGGGPVECRSARAGYATRREDDARPSSTDDKPRQRRSPKAPRSERKDAGPKNHARPLRGDPVRKTAAPSTQDAFQTGMDTDSWSRIESMDLESKLAYYKSEIQAALLRQEPERLMRVLLYARDNLDFIASIPPLTFSEMLLLMGPEALVTKHMSAMTALSRPMVKQLQLAPLQRVVEEYLETILAILDVRRNAGGVCSLQDYRILLDIASKTGNTALAKALWGAMARDNVDPDTICYNRYLASQVWNDLFNNVNFSLRVTPENLVLRSAAELPPGFDNYRVGADGIKSVAMRIFNNMLSNGIAADEETFCHLMTGLAKEGDLNTLKSILIRVWGIHVRPQMPDHPPTVFMDKSSPLFPSNRLLSTLAFAFCINGDVPTALSVLDYVLRHYNLQAGTDVWEQLFTWTYVLSLPGKKRRALPGALPLQTLGDLYQTLTKPPYNVKPTMPMHNQLVRNYFHRRQLPDMYAHMQLGRKQYHADFLEYRKAYTLLEDAIESDRRGQTSGIPLETRRRDYDHASIVHHRNHNSLQRWMRLLLATTTKSVRGALGPHQEARFPGKYAAVSSWVLTTLPALLAPGPDSWAFVAPARITYQIPGGEVSIVLHSTKARIVLTKRRLRVHRLRERVVQAGPRRVLGGDWIKRNVSATRLLKRSSVRTREMKIKRKPLMEEKNQRRVKTLLQMERAEKKRTREEVGQDKKEDASEQAKGRVGRKERQKNLVDKTQKRGKESKDGQDSEEKEGEEKRKEKEMKDEMV